MVSMPGGYSPRVPEFLVLAFFTSLPTLMQNYAKLQESNDQLLSQFKPEYILNITEEFDYIVVGGGSAGSVVANRLSAIPGNRVLLLEIGGDPSPYEELPSLHIALRELPPIFNVYKTEVQNNVCLNTNEACSILTGRGLGGGSAVNGMVYLRGSPNDVNKWARITNDTSWSYSNVLKAFKKSEDYHGFFNNDGKFHGEKGKLYVGRDGESKFKNLFFETAKQRNFQLRDFNSDFKSGYGPADMNIKDGRRFEVYKAFIKPILRRQNLNIYRYAQATKIHLDKSGKAIGVSYVRHGTIRYVKVKQEVIVSAGAVESAKLLLLSGIGPKAHLQSVGVNSILELPVGQHFQDHVACNVYFSVNETLSYSPRRDLKTKDITEYVTRGTGPLGIFAFNPVTILYTNSSGSTTEYPDLEIMAFPLYEPANMNYTLDRFLLSAVLLRPDSFGQVQLASSDPSIPAKVDPKYLSTASDTKRLMEAVLFSVNFIQNSKVFQSLDATIAPNEPIAGCEPLVFKSAAYWECFIRHQEGIPFWHLFGTNRMGRSGDPKAVVDSKLRVFKTTGLRVIDASIIPGPISGHTNAAAIMIGEIGSSFILGRG